MSETLRLLVTRARNFFFIFCIICLPAVSAATHYPAISSVGSNAPELTIETRSLIERLIATRPQASPGSSISTPTAFGINWRTLVIGVSGQNGTQYTHRPFGQYALGFGLGDADQFVSLTTIATLGGLDEVTRDGNFNLQISHNLTNNDSNGLTAIALGVENIGPWGADKRNNINAYLVASTVQTLALSKTLRCAINFSFGLGDSRFVHNYEVHKNEVKVWRPFASVGLQVLPQAALMLDYVGLTLNAGMSFVPLPNFPLVMSVSANDLTNRGGSHIPIAGSIGYSYTF